MNKKWMVCIILCSLLLIILVICHSQKNANAMNDLRVIECVYKDESSDIEIYYPQLTGFINISKEDQINELILTDIKKVIMEGMDKIGDDFTIELKYEIKLMNENMISIFYHGMYGKNGMGHGLSAMAMSTNIDIKNEKIVLLQDIVIDFDELRKRLLNDEFESISVWEGIKGTDTISREYEGNEAKLVENLRKENFDILNHYIEWYVDGENFILVSLYSSIYQEYSQKVINMEHIFNEYFLKLLK